MNSFAPPSLMGRYLSRVLTLVTLLLISRVCYCRNSTTFCSEQERGALLNLRQSLEDPHNLLSSWKGEECCRWEGVTCDIYGHIIELQLSLHGEDEKSQMLVLAGELNSSLLHLMYLKHLDFSGINFQRRRIPEFLGSMKQLKYLNLSFANFYGTVPRQLGNLTKLEVLDLRAIVHVIEEDIIWIPSLLGPHKRLVVDDTLWVSHLRSLKYIDISGSKIANARGLMQLIGTLPCLSHLSLSDCELQNFHLPSVHLANSTSFGHLQYLDLSNNLFQGPIHSTIFQNMTSLQYLDLSGNSFNSSIPMWFDKFANIAHLYLQGNPFDSIEGGLFSFLKNKPSLKLLYLSFTKIREEISMTPGNASGLIEHSLEILEITNSHLKGALPNWLQHFTNLKDIVLSGNAFSGTIPSSLGRLSSLEYLDLSLNQLVGSIPESLGELRALQVLYLGVNGLNGTIPDSLGKLSQLVSLGLWENSLSGVISEIHLSNLSRLLELNVGSNSNLTFRVEPSWIPPFQLELIELNSCKFGTTFPQWIRTQVTATEILLSNASLFGPLPNWLANFTDCDALELSHNFFSGSLPTNLGAMPRLGLLYLDDNLINGTIPSSLCDIEHLVDLSLANNKLSGSIPGCWKGSLSNLILSFNELTGVIPSSIGSLPELVTLDLNGNHLNGEVPLSLRYCTSLIVLDLGENNLSGSIPTWFNETFQFLEILRLRQNGFTGSIPPQLCSLFGLQILDIAVNNLTGKIPRCLGNLRSMMNFNQVNPDGTIASSPYTDWAQQHVFEIMKGRYYEYTSWNLPRVVNLDLSSNFLIGSIPEELFFLSGLHGMNLSHNRLSGYIPSSIGNMRSLESLDLSNNRLFGTIPQGISELTFLAYLNLSQNNFTGQIPKGNQIQTLDDPSIYIGNPLLCGDILRRKCLAAEPPQVAPFEDMHDKDKLEKVLFYGVLMLGFATGFWGFSGVLEYKRDWRLAYFSFVDQAVVVTVAQLKRLRWSRDE